jgi:hypothetical protein
MDCALFRWLYNCSKGDLGKKLMIGGIQLGVGGRSGAAILGRSLDAAYQEGKTVTVIDSAKRIWDGKLRELFSRLKGLPLSIWRFIECSMENLGKVVVVMKTSLKQGCPLSGDYYMLASARMLRRMETDLKTSEEECREQGRIVDSNGVVIGYLDDIFVVNDPCVTAINIPKLSISNADHKAKLCIEKSKIIGQGVFDHDDVPHGWEISQDGGVTVGAPFGDRFWKKDFIEVELRKKYPPKLALSILSPRLSVALILLSYSERGSYSRCDKSNNEFSSEIWRFWVARGRGYDS